MLRSIFVYIYFVFSLIGCIPSMIKAGRLKDRVPDALSAADYATYVHRTTSRWAKKLSKATGSRLCVSGLEHTPVKTDRAVLFVSNHQSDFDILVMLACAPCPIGFIAKIEMLKVPLLRTWMKLMHCVFLDRNDIRQSAKTILEGINILKNGHSMVLFPEGTRSKSDEMLPFKAGSFKLATKSKVPIVPVTIKDSYKVFEGNHYKIKPAEVKVIFHPPVYVDGLDAEELAALPNKVREIINKGLNN